MLKKSTIIVIALMSLFVFSFSLFSDTPIIYYGICWLFLLPIILLISYIISNYFDEDGKCRNFFRESKSYEKIPKALRSDVGHQSAPIVRSIPTPMWENIADLRISSICAQVQETAALINKTANPSVFFGRLNFLLDCLLDLKQYERYNIFTDINPSTYYDIIVNNIEYIVDSFIDRVVSDNKNKVAKLKTPSAIYRNTEKCLIALISAFDCANTFWSGNSLAPHYNGYLYTEANYNKVLGLYNGLDDLYENLGYPDY